MNKDLPYLTEQEADTICLFGGGERCCRYLVMGAGGLQCAKHDFGLRMTLDARKDMVAKGDNCEGKHGEGTLTGGGSLRAVIAVLRKT